MKILIALIVEISAVLAIEEHIDYSNVSSHASGDLRKEIPSQLDEVVTQKPTNDIQLESKGGALQKILSSVSFICKGRFEGYYSDTDFGCQIFHYCKQNGLRFTFVCPTKSIFNQKEMTCDHNVSDPKLFCEESPNYYYLNSILYAQRKDVINQMIDTNSSENRLENKSIASSTSTIFPNSQQSISPTVILPINTTTVAIRPFWGFNVIHPKTINNETNKSLPVINPVSPPIEPTLTPNWFTEAFQLNPYSHQKLKLAQNTQNDTDSNDAPYWFIMKNKNYNNDLLKPNHSKHLTSSLKPTNNAVSTVPPVSSSGHTDWDDIETGDKVYKTQLKLEEFKPLFREPSLPVIGLNSAHTAPVAFPAVPALPLPLLNSGPTVVLRPANIPGTLPITTLYKQTQYMFGKPRVVHKGLYRNPTIGAAILNPHSLIGSISPVGLNVAASQNLYSIQPNHNSNLLSNFQNALNKFSFNDIFGLKLLNSPVPKQKRSDFSHVFNLKTALSPQKPLLHKSNLPNPYQHSNKMPLYLSPINQRSQNNLDNPMDQEVYLPFNFPVKLETFSDDSSVKMNRSNEKLTNEHFVHLKSPESVTSSSVTTSGYSLRMEDTVSKKNLMQPSVFYAISSKNIRNKWFQTYQKIKQIYTEREQINPRHYQPKSASIANLTSNLEITNRTNPIIPNIADKIILFKI